MRAYWGWRWSSCRSRFLHIDGRVVHKQVSFIRYKSGLTLPEMLRYDVGRKIARAASSLRWHSDVPTTSHTGPPAHQTAGALAMKSPLRVAVTGAAGQIGYSLLFRIASGEMLGKDQPV